MSDTIIIYGAYGFTGRLVAEAAVVRGLKVRLAGRNADKLQVVAQEFGCDYTAVSLDDTAGLHAILQPAKAVLHCAGPFMDTSAQMVQACLDTSTHYVDITGERTVYEACHALDAKARDKGVMLLPGGGFDVLPTDCVSGMLKQRLPDATHLTLAFESSGGMSRGTMRTGARMLTDPLLVRRDGKLVGRPDTPSMQVDFGNGPVEVTAATWGDVITAWYSTGIPNIEVFMEMPASAKSMLKMPKLLKIFLASPFGRGIVERQLRNLQEGPSEEAQANGYASVYGLATNAAGKIIEVRLRTHEAYRLTAEGMAEIGSRILSGNAPVGYQTPAMAYGHDLVLALEGSEMIEV